MNKTSIYKHLTVENYIKPITLISTLVFIGFASNLEVY